MRAKKGGTGFEPLNTRYCKAIGVAWGSESGRLEVQAMQRSEPVKGAKLGRQKVQSSRTVLV